MATRRVKASVEDTQKQAQVGSSAPGTTEKSNTAPAVPTPVIVKLLAFTAAMIVAPIGTYFLTYRTIFSHSATLAGASAAVMANIVLIGYVIVAMKEDQSDRLAAEENAKKGQ